MMTKQNILKMVAMAKTAGAYVVLGGPEPPYYAEDYLQRGADIIVRGEGELTLEALIPHLTKHGLNKLGEIEGIIYRDDNETVTETSPRPFVKDLDSLPFPDREAIDLPEYMRIWKDNHGHSSISVIQARGCAYSCTWCSHSVYGVSHRRISPQRAAEEIAWIHERYNPDLIWYADDVFAVQHRWLFAYHDELKQRGIKIPFECISRADRLNEKVIDILAEMGCFRLWNGSESGSQRVLDAMNRKVKVEDVQNKTHMLQKAGIQTGMFIMLGYDGETVEDIIETVNHLKICNPDVFLTTIAYPIKGTPYYAEVQGNILSSKEWSERSDRDLTVAGRYSRRFYNYATRWMVNEVALNRARKNGGAGFSHQLKMRANIAVGRVGMMLTQNDIETVGTPVHPTHEPA
jgi:radical SAM superfamily enzyme YgiQ (UPF0313 family)